jgi:hypothetical protein
MPVVLPVEGSLDMLHYVYNDLLLIHNKKNKIKENSIN